MVASIFFRKCVVAGSLHVLAALIAQHPDLPHAPAPARSLFALLSMPSFQPFRQAAWSVVLEG